MQSDAEDFRIDHRKNYKYTKNMFYNIHTKSITAKTELTRNERTCSKTYHFTLSSSIYFTRGLKTCRVPCRIMSYNICKTTPRRLTSIYTRQCTSCVRNRALGQSIFVKQSPAGPRLKVEGEVENLMICGFRIVSRKISIKIVTDYL